MAIINQEKIDQLLSTENLPSEQAMFLLRAGKKVYRAGWKNIRYIEMQKPDEFSKMRKAYLFAIDLLFLWSVVFMRISARYFIHGCMKEMYVGVCHDFYCMICIHVET